MSSALEIEVAALRARLQEHVRMELIHFLDVVSSKVDVDQCAHGPPGSQLGTSSKPSIVRNSKAAWPTSLRQAGIAKQSDGERQSTNTLLAPPTWPSSQVAQTRGAADDGQETHRRPGSAESDVLDEVIAETPTSAGEAFPSRQSHYNREALKKIKDFLPGQISEDVEKRVRDRSVRFGQHGELSSEMTPVVSLNANFSGDVDEDTERATTITSNTVVRSYESSYASQSLDDSKTRPVLMRGTSRPFFARSDRTYGHAAIERLLTEKALLDAHKLREKTVLQRITDHSFFEFGSCMLIVANTILNGAEVEMISSGTEDEFDFQALQSMFSGLFMVELLLRMAAQKEKFFKSADKLWNIFDTSLVLIGVVEFILTVTVGNLLDSNARLLRSLRIFRNLRIVRMLRFFSALRSMIAAILGSVKTLMCLVILLWIMLFFFSLCLTAAVAEHIQALDDLDDEPSMALLAEEMGSLLSTAFCLFKAITGGITWGEVYDPLEQTGLLNAGLFLGFIIFAVFAFLNTVTSVFVDNAMRTSQSQQDQRIQRELEFKEETEKQLADIFAAMDIYSTGLIAQEELQAYLQDENAVANLAALGIDMPDAAALFRLVDENGDGTLDIDEFISGCLRLKGAAKSAEIAEMRNQTSKILRRLTRFMIHSQRVHDIICKSLEKVAPLNDEDLKEIDLHHKQAFGKDTQKVGLLRLTEQARKRANTRAVVTHWSGSSGVLKQLTRESGGKLFPR